MGEQESMRQGKRRSCSLSKEMGLEEEGELVRQTSLWVCCGCTAGAQWAGECGARRVCQWRGLMEWDGSAGEGLVGWVSAGHGTGVWGKNELGGSKGQNREGTWGRGECRMGQICGVEDGSEWDWRKSGQKQWAREEEADLGGG